MGKHFGNLAYIRGIIYFRLSSYEQRAYAGALTKGLPNFVPRTLMTLPFWMPRKYGLENFVNKTLKKLYIKNLQYGRSALTMFYYEPKICALRVNSLTPEPPTM